MSFLLSLDRVSRRSARASIEEVTSFVLGGAVGVGCFFRSRASTPLRIPSVGSGFDSRVSSLLLSWPNSVWPALADQ